MIRKLVFWVLLIVTLGVWALSDQLFPPERVQAETAIVRDGDSLELAGRVYRLYGIDAPEYRQTCQDRVNKPWPCGKAARLQLAALVAPGAIVCEPRAEDRYNRKVAKCASATVPDLAEAMVQAGLAISPAERGSAPYQAAEEAARAARRGIWQGEFQAPRAWRDAHARTE